MFQSLDLIFEDSELDSFKDDSPLLGIRKKKIETKTIKKEKVEKKKKKAKPKRSSRKTFSTNLDILFEGPKVEKKEKDVKKPTKDRLAGIDLLIRGTLSKSAMRVEQVAPEKKRVTFILDKEKLSKIKNIAKSEKAYIKDIFDRVVTDYLKKQGLLD